MLKSLNMKDTMLSIHRINQTYFIPTDSTIMRWIAINSFNVHYKTLIIFVLCISTPIIAAAPYDDTFWDDDHQPHQQPVKSKIFGDNSCYTSSCSSDTTRVLKEITDRVQCYDETSPCRCCLRRTLSTKELRELNQEISFQLLPATGKSCKTLDCDDYQVKAIRSLSNPNAECFDYGIQCRCCVNTRLKNEDISSLVKDLKRLKDKSDRNQTPDHFDIGSFDTFSDSHDRFDSPSFELPFFHSNGKSSGNDPSTTSDGRRRSHFSSSDCSHYDCNGPEVKNIKKMPSNIMSCVKIGNTNKCDCCFNNTLSSSDRLKYEFELFSTGRSAAGSDFRPSYNSYGSNRGSSLGSRDQNYQLNGGLCGSYDCSNDFLKLFEGHSRYFFTCSRSSGGQCKCCINLDLRNLDEFLKLPVL